MKSELYLSLLQIINKDRIFTDEPMFKHTTFRIGGKADYFVEPADPKELSALLKLLNQVDMPYYILGNGSNLLVGDYGYRGVIIEIGKAFQTISYEEKEDGILVTAGAGILLSKLSNYVAEHSLEGFEFASGIPGTLGGAVTMNAGAYGGEIKDCIESAHLMDKSGNCIVLDKEGLNLSYRNSIVQRRSYIVLEASFRFKKGNKEQIKSKINELNQQRREKQPLEYPSAGSTFKRPDGYFAGKLIMDAGLRGYRVGDIMISNKHCGFVVNLGNGTAKDVKKLIEDVKRIVKEKFGVDLEPEVRMIGDFE